MSLDLKNIMSRLKEKYENEVIPTLLREFGIKNKMAVPKVEKVVINVGIGEISKNKELIEAVKKDLASITGQMPQVRQAKKSVAGFGVRRGMIVGLKVTLRKNRMYSFLDKLFSIVLPRLRDFRGVPLKNFDERGNYTLGFVDAAVFPEIDPAKSQLKGLEVTIVTNSKDQQKSKRMLELMGMPFEKG